MYGAYLLRSAPVGTTMPWSEYRDRIGMLFDRARFNIRPSQNAIVIRMESDDIVCDAMPWGFKPSWSKYSPSINVRAEDVFERKLFKGALYRKRCLIIADGFYEPKGPKSEKSRPWYMFEYPDKRTFAFAGIWAGSGFAIFTNDPNSQVLPIHDRMPHILSLIHI